jgi:menaquinone-9 beta-reductase
MSSNQYDLAITGGGLAGLSLAILSARRGHRVILFEKENYPFHKVCGEYISLESKDFLIQLGIDLNSLNVSSITDLQVTTWNGNMFRQRLPLGGFGISRYLLDHKLAIRAREAGVNIYEGAKVNEILFGEDGFTIDTSAGVFYAKLASGSFGKRSNLDIKWKRPFTSASKNKLNNYIGVKYHIRSDIPKDIIALHNFNNGYCGVVKIEDDKYCLCYLTTAANLQLSNGSIPDMEGKILARNPFLKTIWSSSDFISRAPITISQVSFQKKSQVENHVLMTGDAAGMITPLCGNGMSMALHAGKIAAEEIHSFLTGNIVRTEMETNYAIRWNKQFEKRLRIGRGLQGLLSSSRMINLFVPVARRFPKLVNYMIRQTHGEPF